LSPNIRIDREVYRALQEGAQPFVDTPNSVLRRLLGLESDLGRPEEENAKEVAAAVAKRTKKEKAAGTRGMGTRASERTERTRSPRAGKRGTRAPSDSILPEGEYLMPLLETLAERGGSAPAREVVAEVGRRLRDRLMPMDMESLASGGIRWQNRVQFVRLRLVEEGLIERKSPRGVWALTKAGMARARGEAA
jgi:hypothetical protein